MTEAQIIRVVREAEVPGAQGRDGCRQDGLAEPPWYRWRRREGGLESAEGVRLRQLEREHGRVKTRVAERDRELEGLKALLATPWSGARRG